MSELAGKTFAPKGSLVPTAPEPAKVYDSGYTEEQIIVIKQAKGVLDKRNLVTEPVTLDEFRDIIIPWQRIHRTEAFNLNPEKVKPVKVPKVPKEKVAKSPRVAKVPGEKKLTKKAIEERINTLVFKLAVGEPLSEEETLFFNEHTSKNII